MEQDIAKRAIGILCEQLGVKEDRIRPESRLVDDLGADSLDTVELIMAFEEEFGIVIPDEEAEKLLTVKELTTYLEGQLSSQKKKEAPQEPKVD